MNIKYTKRVIFILLFASNALLLMAREAGNKMESDSSGTTVPVPFYEISLNNSTAPVQIIDGQELESVPGTDVRLALPGKITNSIITQRYNILGSQADMQIRGSNYLVLIDGIPRPLSEISAYEVESINIIKGFSGTAMFGSDASNGIIYVKTKKGIAGQKAISMEVDQGMSFVQKKYLPNWVSAYDYVTLYNEASQNDGLILPYTEDDLAGYQAGNASLRYPDEDLYNQIFNESMNYTRINLNFRGGDESTRYFINMGYQSEGKGLYKIADFNTNVLRLRANLDVSLSEMVDLSVGAFAGLDLKTYSNAENEVWNVLSTYPPNAYPVVIAPDSFGTNPAYPINPVGDLTEYLNTTDIDRTGRFNIKLSVNLSWMLPGLKLDNMLAYDISTFARFRQRPNKTYPLYEPVFNDEDGIPDSLIQYGLFDPSAGVNMGSNNYNNRLYQYNQLAYTRQFGKHLVDAGIVNSLQFNSYRLNNAFEQDIRKHDVSFRAHYSFDNKYNLDLIQTYSGIMNLPAHNRYKAFPTVGASWVVSEEAFLKSIDLISHLKFRASYGKLGIFNSSDLFIHSSYWDQSGWHSFDNYAESSSLRFRGTRRMQIGNEDIAWGEMTEMNVGADLALLKNRIALTFDYFNRTSKGLVMDYPIPTIAGTGNYRGNVGSNETTGFDAALSANLVSGKDFGLALNLSMGHYVTTVLKNNELDVPYEWMSRIGRPSDAIYGLQAEGLIASDQPEGEPIPLFGKVEPGNIKYTDLNNDGFIMNEIDEQMIGNNRARYNYGLNLSVRYKQLSLCLNGYGLSGYQTNVLNHPYFYVYGNDKYSAYAMENRWTPDNPDVNAKHPRLTTTSNSNDRRTSTYWLRDRGFFRLKNAELAYTFNMKDSDKRQVRVFARGTNLFTISKIKELDPEDLDNGVTTYPSMQTFSMGLSVTLK